MLVFLGETHPPAPHSDIALSEIKNGLEARIKGRTANGTFEERVLLLGKLVLTSSLETVSLLRGNLLTKNRLFCVNEFPSFPPSSIHKARRVPLSAFEQSRVTCFYLADAPPRIPLPAC